ncbi:MAG TPA: DNA replication and repair protein RecF [Polyangiaceae bacterium]|nr:DNA replication and repair protein RecF [Polyangiaceae bacterium]
MSVRDFRNIRDVTLALSPKINVISGDNGQGKTSLLEAVYFVATSRSFRAERASEMKRQGSEATAVRARIIEGGHAREQRATLVGKERSVLVDGKRPDTLAAYATRTPVVVFHPGDLGILTGPASERRTLLDRVALFLDPASGDHRARYSRATQSRKAALAERGAGAAELEPLERLMAQHGAALGRARAEAARRLVEALLPAFVRMGAPGLELVATFVPGGSLDENVLLAELARRRETDLRRGMTTFGPHKDDLELTLDGRSTRRHASQGQQRITTLALKVAELDCVRAARGAEPVLLLDDVSSELDPGRTGAVYEFLNETTSQVLATTTRPELFHLPGLAPSDRADFRVVEGALAPA